VKGINNPEEQWMIILGKTIDKTKLPLKYKMVWWRRCGEIIVKFFITKIWVPIRWHILRRQGNGSRG
jgi:hypothetical protein